LLNIATINDKPYENQTNDEEKSNHQEKVAISNKNFSKNSKSYFQALKRYKNLKEKI
jgi:hypothetical protein